MIQKSPFLRVAELVAISIVSSALGILFLRYNNVVAPIQRNRYHDRYSTTISNSYNITSTKNTIRTTLSTLNITNQEIVRRTLFLKHENRIVGGTPVEDGEFPFFVHPIGMMLCGATLIHPEYVHKYFEMFYFTCR
jgi:hypothetical protein